MLLINYYHCLPENFYKFLLHFYIIVCDQGLIFLEIQGGTTKHVSLTDVDYDVIS